MAIQRKIIGDMDKIYTQYNADIVCKEITAYVKSHGNLKTGNVVNKFYNVELCSCVYGSYLIITSGTIGSEKQDVKVEAYSNVLYLKEHYDAWKAKLTKNGYHEIDVLALDNNTCSPYAQNFLAEYKMTMTKSEAQGLVATNKHVVSMKTAEQPIVNLDKAVKQFVKTIYAEAGTYVREYLDATKLQGTGSICTVTKKSIETGRTLLAQLIEKQNLLVVTKGAEQRSKIEEDIATLSNQYNSVIPRILKQKGKHAWCLNTGDLVVAQYDLLDMLELMIANTLLSTNEDINIEQKYKALNTDIKHVTDKHIIEQVARKIKAEQMQGHNFRTKLVNVYEIEQHNAPKFDDSCGNVVSLFHGTGASNLYGILSTHLKVPAKTGSNIHITGRMFGDGVYFGQYSKALQYATRRFGGTKNKGRSYFLLLCEVALGKIHMETQAKHFSVAPHGSHSVMGVGQDMLYGDCVILGVGEAQTLKIPKSSVQRQIGKSALQLLHNEFIVYNQARFRIKYVVEVEEVN